LESDDSIIILATGKDFATSAKQEQQIGEDYLKEKKAKVKAIIVNNTNFRNINLLEEVCRCIGSNIPIYSSYPSKIIILNHFPTLKNRIVAVDKEKEIQLDDFRARFLPLSSYLAGNLAVKLDHSNFSFYFIEGIVSSNLLDNKLLAPRNFHHDLHQFLQSKQSNSCLITSFQGIH
jgi:mRNA degradation ribonuclease J1/J2